MVNISKHIISYYVILISHLRSQICIPVSSSLLNHGYKRACSLGVMPCALVEANIQLLPSDMREWTLAAEKAQRVDKFSHQQQQTKNLRQLCAGQIRRRNDSVMALICFLIRTAWMQSWHKHHMNKRRRMDQACHPW